VSWVLIVAGATGWALALVLLLVLPARSRRQALRLALRLRSQVRPYLQRRALEAKLDVAPAEQVQDPEQIVDDICQLADNLTQHERSQIELGDTMNMAVSDTMPFKKDKTTDPATLEQLDKLDKQS
jgi:hypothetical protein